MVNTIITEFQKLRRYSIVLVGIIGVTFSPIISIAMQNMMNDEAKSVLNYTFPDLLNSTIWNNMTIFFPMILTLIGGYIINREYTDDTWKNLLTIPVSFSQLVRCKLLTLSIIAILLGIYNSIVTILVGVTCCHENMSFSTVAYGSFQIMAMAVFSCIAVMPLLAFCSRKKDAFKGGAVIAFLLGYVSIYFKNPIIRNAYPFSAGLSLIGFDGEGFVTDTIGKFSSSQSSLIGVFSILAMVIVAEIIIHIPVKESTAFAKKSKEHNRKSRRSL